MNINVDSTRDKTSHCNQFTPKEYECHSTMEAKLNTVQIEEKYSQLQLTEFFQLRVQSSYLLVVKGVPLAAL